MHNLRISSSIFDALFYDEFIVRFSKIVLMDTCKIMNKLMYVNALLSCIFHKVYGAMSLHMYIHAIIFLDQITNKLSSKYSMNHDSRINIVYLV